MTNCLLSSPFSAHQPCVAPTLVCDIGYLIGELIVAAVFVHACLSDLGQTLFVNNIFSLSLST